MPNPPSPPLTKTKPSGDGSNASLARNLFARLADEQVRCVVYKNGAELEAALNGAADFDLLVAPDDLSKLRVILHDAGGIRAYPSKLYDNAIPEREDWLVPVGGTRILHFDLARAVMTGPKFHKRYRTLGYDDLAPNQIEETELRGLRRVAPDIEAQITMVRAAFANKRWSPARWLRADDELARVLGAALPPGTGDHVFAVEVGGQTVLCPVRRHGSLLLVDRRKLRDMRRAVRQDNGVGQLGAVQHLCWHWIRRTSFAVMRRITRLTPGRAVDKRRLRQGCIVALVGPDGVGKSTQSARVADIFGQKIRCTPVYLGSNDGSWMKIRGRLGLSRSAREKRATQPAAIEPASAKRERSALHSLGSAIWRLVVAVNRYVAVRRALRLAAAGTLVVADRWPQNIAEGILDGPSTAPPRTASLAVMLWRLEKRLYRSMERFKPDFTIHLVCDYATSHARKPGDIDRPDFERRIALMETMRDRDSRIAIADAAEDADAVTFRIVSLIWQALEMAGEANFELAHHLKTRPAR